MTELESDQWGEYNPDGGAKEPQDADELGYEPCNAVMKFTYSRYGEKRYCTGMAVSNFGDIANYEHGEYCKHHQSRHDLKENQITGEEVFKHGAYVRSYEQLYDYLPPHKQVMAIDLYKSLLDESVFDDWDIETMVREVETDGTFGDGDSIYTDFPVPTNRKARAAALWFASIDFIKMQNINEEQFRVAFEEKGPRGEPMAVGENKFEKETESGDTVEIKDEHHLNLPLSRIQKDYERHLKMGGVSLDAADDNQVDLVDKRDWVSEVEEPDVDAEQAFPETQ